jgi:hypothetical protein
MRSLCGCPGKCDVLEQRRRLCSDVEKALGGGFGSHFGDRPYFQELRYRAMEYRMTANARGQRDLAEAAQALGDMTLFNDPTLDEYGRDEIIRCFLERAR